MASPYEMSIEELEQFIANYPKASACNRADIETFNKLLQTRKEQQSVETP